MLISFLRQPYRSATGILSFSSLFLHKSLDHLKTQWTNQKANFTKIALFVDWVDADRQEKNINFRVKAAIGYVQRNYVMSWV